jgi:hypothetical protein
LEIENGLGGREKQKKRERVKERKRKISTIRN